MAKKILIADDEVANIKCCRAVLLDKDPNHQITAVVNGLEALEILRQEVFDLVITDLQMPRLTGLQAIMVFREERPGIFSGTRIIFITGTPTQELEEFVGKNHQIRLLLKPFNLEKFLKLVEE